jgi:hypothetical protein
MQQQNTPAKQPAIDPNAPIKPAQATACCSPTAQESCCAPAAKTACCGADGTGCGCR